MRAKAEAGGLVNLDEAMAYLRVSRSKLYLLMESGQLPYVKLGKCRRVPMSELDKLIERNTHPARPDDR
jgi:excisionase family DNA binding protein